MEALREESGGESDEESGTGSEVFKKPDNITLDFCATCKQKLLTTGGRNSHKERGHEVVEMTIFPPEIVPRRSVVTKQVSNYYRTAKNEDSIITDYSAVSEILTEKGN